MDFEPDSEGFGEIELELPFLRVKDTTNEIITDYGLTPTEVFAALRES